MTALPRRPFRFGVQASSTPDRASWVALAKRVESLGYATLTMPDHFTDQLAPVPALMAAADATTTLRVGALVWDNDYKHPAVLAKELATIDVLSEGRLEIGIGAGWTRSDYDAVGMPYDPPGVRVDRFMEGIDVMKGCFSEGAFSYAGSHYTITNYDSLPLPVQRPWPPILIGGGGKRVLSIAARHADIVGINGTMTAGTVGAEALQSMTADAVDDKVAIVRDKATDRLDQIELSVRAFFVSITNDRAGTIDGLAGALQMPVEAVEATPFALIGTPKQLVDDLRQRRERWGFSYIVVGAEDVDAFAPVVAELTGR